MTNLGSNANRADGFAQVGVQVGVALGDVVHTTNNTYNVPPGASPAERFEVGLRYLRGGAPAKALELIEEAMHADPRNSRVRFYWVLAILSGRTLSQLTDEDEARLKGVLDWPMPHTGDDWVEALRVIERILASLSSPDEDPQTALKAFDELPDARGNEILQHLQLFFKEKIQDEMWQRAVSRAQSEQLVVDRADRVWIFFEPDPQPPRRAASRPVATTFRDQTLAWITAAAFLVSCGYLCILVVLSGRHSPMVACLAASLGAVAFARSGTEWRYRDQRLKAKDREHRPLTQPPRKAPKGGFASKVDRLFRQYTGLYLPAGSDRQTWTSQLSGVHRTIRDEIVTTFRDSPPQAQEIAWLIRHRVADARTRWQNGSIWCYRSELRMPLTGRLLTVLGLAALVLGSGTALPAALAQDPFRASAATVVAIAAGWVASVRWLTIILEKRRLVADEQEATARYESDLIAFERWKAKLSRRPDDREMATWLDHDRRLLVNQAMKHYNLAPSHVIASAFIEGPGSNARRARVRNGPWRYSRYQILVFLLTEDGVRQMSAELDFANANTKNRQRVNYRYEAVASVHVEMGGRAKPTFKLTLVNGSPIDMQVTAADVEASDMHDDSLVAEEVTLDSTGLKSTLHVLEGIAAEGRRWIDLDKRRRSSRMHALKAAIEKLAK